MDGGAPTAVAASSDASTAEKTSDASGGGDSGGGGGGSAKPRVRSFFPETWLWEKVVTTIDRRGLAGGAFPNQTTNYPYNLMMEQLVDDEFDGESSDKNNATEAAPFSIAAQGSIADAGPGTGISNV